MPDEPDIELADALVADLVANANLGEAFDAERTWLPDWDTIPELEKLRVMVQPGFDPAAEEGERGLSLEMWTMDFGFARRLKLQTRAEIDALCRATGVVRDRYKRATIETDGGLQFETSGAWQYLVRVDPALINREKRASGQIAYTGSFLSVLRMTFRRVD